MSEGRYTVEISKEIVDKYIKDFDELYEKKEKLLKELFEAKEGFNNIFLRVVVLNDFYSTNLGRYDNANVEEMAVHIYEGYKNKDLDELISSDDYNKRIEAYDYISKVGEGFSRASSFASKYCNWCEPEKFPIMDSYAKGMIYCIVHEYESLDKKNVTQTKIADYEFFCEQFEKVRSFINEKCNKTYSVKDVDKFLWSYGKEKDIKI